MTQLKRRACFTLVIWTLVLVFFILLFFTGGGPSEWAKDRTRKLCIILVFGVGYFSYILMMIMTKSKTVDGVVHRDERDNLIEMRSSRAAFIIVLLYVYILSITLYVSYESVGLIPISWLWFLGYTSIIIGSISYASTSLLLDNKLS